LRWVNVPLASVLVAAVLYGPTALVVQTRGLARTVAWQSRTRRLAVDSQPCDRVRGTGFDREAAAQFRENQDAEKANDGSRRQLLGMLASVCFGCALGAQSARAQAKIGEANPEALLKFDILRNRTKDYESADKVAYEHFDEQTDKQVIKRKKEIFAKLFKSLPQEKKQTFVELGIGGFPNARYYKADSAPPEMDIVGIDPNDYMKKFVFEAGLFAKLNDRGHTVKFQHGVAEALPFENKSVDVVVASSILCTVLDPQRAISEIKRVLKPGGKFVFWEHVLSTDPEIAAKQTEATPNQIQVEDNCHLDRNTMQFIKDAGFTGVEAEIFNVDVSVAGLRSPTAAGIATA